jgi:hypothetical protein
MGDVVTLAVVVVVAVAAFTAGWLLRDVWWSPERRHERALGEFARTQGLQPLTPRADLDDTLIAFDGPRLRYVGTDRSGVEVYVNAEPWPNVNAIAVENLPSQSAIVIIGDQP